MVEDCPKGFFLPGNIKLQNFEANYTRRHDFYVINNQGFDYTGKCFFQITGKEEAQIDFYKPDRSVLDNDQLANGTPPAVIKKSVSIRFLQKECTIFCAIFDPTNHLFYYLIKSKIQEEEIAPTIDIYVVDIGDIDKYTESYNEIKIDNSKKGNLSIAIEFPARLEGETSYYLKEDNGKKYLIILNVYFNSDYYEFTCIEYVIIDVIEIVGQQLQHLHHTRASFDVSFFDKEGEQFLGVLHAGFNESTGVLYFGTSISEHYKIRIYEIGVHEECVKHVYTWMDLYDPYAKHLSGNLLLLITEGDTSVDAVIWKIENGEKQRIKEIRLHTMSARSSPLFCSFTLLKLFGNLVMVTSDIHYGDTFLFNVWKGTRLASIQSRYENHYPIMINWNSKEVAFCCESRRNNATLLVDVHRLEHKNVASLKYLSRLAVLTKYSKNFLVESTIPLVLKKYLDIL